MSLADSIAQTGATLRGATGRAQPAPAYRLTLDGRDISSKFNNRLLSLKLTDNRGFEADQLEIDLDDSDGLLAMPDRGVTIEVALGWAGSALIDKGSYVVDSVRYKGAPDKLTLSAKSANLRAGLSTKKEKSWNGQKISAIVESIAAANDLTPRVSPKLADVLIEHVDQTNESDVNLLTRLAQDYDAIATVKKGMLLFMPIGEAESATGTPFPTSTVQRNWGDSFSFSVSAKETFKAVKAYYQNLKDAAQPSITLDEDGITDDDGKPTTKSSGKSISKTTESSKAKSSSDSKTKVLRHTYPTRDVAVRAAQAEWQRLHRGAAQLSLTAVRARPDLFPELPVVVTGFKPAIDELEWIITKCTHNLSASGFSTAFEFELKP